MWIYSLGVTLQQSITSCNVHKNEISPHAPDGHQKRHKNNTNFTPTYYNTNQADDAPTSARHNNATKAPALLVTSSTSSSSQLVTHEPHIQPKANHVSASATNTTNANNEVTSLDTVIATMCHVKLQQRASLMYLLNVSAHHHHLCWVIMESRETQRVGVGWDNSNRSPNTSMLAS